VYQNFLNQKWPGKYARRIPMQQCQGGADVVMEEEPYATSSQKLIVGILEWLPIDSQL
jgi:hypothetical protein